MSVAPDPALIREALVDAGEADPGPDLAIERLPGGASRETWVLGGRWVLKRDHPSETDPPQSAAKEHAALRAAAAAGVPVPRAVACEGAGGRFGTAGYVAERLPGVSSPRRVLTADGPERALIARDLGAALRALSGADPSAVAPDHAAVGGSVAAAVGELTVEVDELAPGRPVLELALRWLDSRRPEERAPVLVHGDFRVGNFLIDEGRLRGVIDWEFCRAGDPAEDAAFLCLRPWRFGADARRAGGLAGLDALLDGYGDGLTPARVRYWEVVGQLRWGLYCLRHAAGFTAGRHRHLERAILGRRVAEVEWDLLDLIEEDG